MENNFENNSENTIVEPHFEDMPQQPQVSEPVVAEPVAQQPVQPAAPIQPQYQPVQPQQNFTDGMGIASMILGIISVVVCCCYGIGAIPALVGLILGICAKKNPNTGNKSGFAIAGIIISAISLLLNICWFVMVILGIGYINIDGGEFYGDYSDIINQYENF